MKPGMARTGLKQRLKGRELTIGSWLSFSFLPFTEMLSRDELDWLVIDLEHTTIDLGPVGDMVMVIERSGLAPLVRVGANDPLIIKRVMDAGAHGIVVPDVRSAADARRAIDAVYYPPRGGRGVGLGRAHGYGEEFEGYLTWLAEEAVVIVQIEHRDAVASLEAILAVPDVDGFIVGPYDLSASIGKPGQFEDPEVIQLFDTVAAAIDRSDKPAGIHVVHPDAEVLRQRIREGYTLVAYGDDMVLYSAAVESLARDIRSCHS